MAPRWLVLLAVSVAAVAAGCGTTGSSGPTAAPTTTIPLEPAGTAPPTTTTVAPTTTAGFPTFQVEALGSVWSIPVPACDAGANPEPVRAAARAAAAALERLAARRASGWPTTSAPPLDDTLPAEIEHAAVRALALAGLVGERARVEADWLAFEQGYADPDQGIGAPDLIASSLAQWGQAADQLAAAVTAACSSVAG